MKIRILECAEAELRHATEYFNGELPGLGYVFADEFRKTVARICANPVAWPRISRRARRALMRRFPYGVVYQPRDGEILIAAVMHLHRHPDSWKIGRRSPRAVQTG